MHFDSRSMSGGNYWRPLPGKHALYDYYILTVQDNCRNLTWRFTWPSSTSCHPQKCLMPLNLSNVNIMIPVANKVKRTIVGTMSYCRASATTEVTLNDFQKSRINCDCFDVLRSSLHGRHTAPFQGTAIHPMHSYKRW